MAFNICCSVLAGAGLGGLVMLGITRRALKIRRLR